MWNSSTVGKFWKAYDRCHHKKLAFFATHLHKVGHFSAFWHCQSHNALRKPPTETKKVLLISDLVDTHSKRCVETESRMRVVDDEYRDTVDTHNSALKLEVLKIARDWQNRSFQDWTRTAIRRKVFHILTGALTRLLQFPSIIIFL